MNGIHTGVGRALGGDYEQFGASIYRDLLGCTSYLGLIAFGLTGRRLSAKEEAILDDLAVASHVPEPRVWPIKIAWIAGALGRSVPAYLCAATALDSDILGGRISENAARLLVALDHAVVSRSDSDAAIAEFVQQNRHLHGFGVPLRPYDERLVAFRAAMERRAFVGGRFWQLADRFWQIVRESRGIEVNIIGATAAICLDMGFTPAQVAPMAVLLLTPTFLANATEAAAQAPDVLKRLPSERVRYVGVDPRVSPRAQAAPRRA